MLRQVVPDYSVGRESSAADGTYGSLLVGNSTCYIFIADCCHFQHPIEARHVHFTVLLILRKNTD